MSAKRGRQNEYKKRKQRKTNKIIINWFEYNEIIVPRKE